MTIKQSVVVHQIADNQSEQRAYYRLLDNDNLHLSDVKSFLYSDCSAQVSSGGHYLLIQDTTQPNFEKNRSNISNLDGLGVIADNKSLGFFLHPSLLVDADDKRSLGFIDIQTWSREVNTLTKLERKHRVNVSPIEHKESFRWISSIQASKLRLPAGCRLTCLSDREGDISELFIRIPDEHTDLLIRSNDNRCLTGGIKLFDHVANLPIMGSYELKIQGDKRINRQFRVAKINLKYSPVILAPAKSKGKEIEVYVVEAREDPSTVPTREDPIHWRLLTTHPVENLQQACLMIDYYKERWLIEQVFRLLKNKGLQIENSQMETGKALICLTIMGLYVVNKVMILHNASKEISPIAINNSFSEEEIACLKNCNKKYEGNTIKQKNPHPENSLQWVYWVLSRMGGWKPHEKNRAGVISIFRGYNYFQQILEGWMMANNSVS